MAKRRASARFVWARWLIVTGALIVGVGTGLGLAVDRFLPGSQSAPPHRATSPQGQSPVAVTPPIPTGSIEVLQDGALDAAVEHAVRRVGVIEEADTQPRTGRIGQNEVRWSRRTLDVHLERPAQNAIAVLRPEVERAGGTIFSADSTTVQIGIFRDGIPFVTHTIRWRTTPVQGRAVIIFDDAGGSLDDLESIIALGRPVTVSVLPGLRYSRDVAARAQAVGLEVFLHLPVEAEDATIKLGPGGVTTAMTDAEIVTMVRADLAWVPGAVGLNNHMGSRGTGDPRVMRAILAVVKERGLVFIDSRTSLRSVGVQVATSMGVPTGARDVFIDNENEPEAIRTQFRRLIALSKERGTAVGIGHAQRITSRILLELLPEFDRAGIEIVPVSTVVH